MYIVDIDIFGMLIFLKVFTRRKAPYLPLFSSWGGNCFTRSANEAFGWHVRALWALGDKLFHTGANEALIVRWLQFLGVSQFLAHPTNFGVMNIYGFTFFGAQNDKSPISVTYF